MNLTGSSGDCFSTHQNTSDTGKCWRSNKEAIKHQEKHFMLNSAKEKSPPSFIFNHIREEGRRRLNWNFIRSTRQFPLPPRPPHLTAPHCSSDTLSTFLLPSCFFYICELFTYPSEDSLSFLSARSLSLSLSL